MSFLIRIQCRRLVLLLLLPSSLQREHRKHAGNLFQNSSSQGVAESELRSLPAKSFHTAPSSFLKQLQRGGSLLPEVRRPNSEAGQRAGAEFPIPTVSGWGASRLRCDQNHSRFRPRGDAFSFNHVRSLWWFPPSSTQ